MGIRDLFRRQRPDEQVEAIAAAAPDWSPPKAEAKPAAAAATATSARLAEGGSVSVSSEEHYQDALKARLGTRREVQVVATLIVNATGNPWVAKQTGPVLEVQIDGATVGFLTPAMTERYMPFAQNAAREGRSLTATAWVSQGDGKGGRDVEISLSAMPMLEGQATITGLSIETTEEFVLFHRTGRAHRIASFNQGWVTTCGESVTEAKAEAILRTKPWVGRVRADGSIFNGSPWWCVRCVPDQAERERVDIEEGGRFGARTSIDRGHRFSSAMNSTAVREALAMRLVFDVAGESHHPEYPENLLRLAEVLRTMDGDEWLAAVLRRDSSNTYDVNAIEIHLPGGGGHCGFVPAELAKFLAPILDEGTVLSASAVEVRIHPDSPHKPGLTIALSLTRVAT